MKTSVIAISLLFAPVAAIADSQLSMELTGTVAPVCAITSNESLGADLSTSSVQSLTFDVYCNTEMTISMQSVNGGMKNTSRAAGNDGNEITYDYTATVSLEKFNFSTSYTSEELVDSVVANVEGGVVFSDTMQVDVELDQELEEGYAGDYSDSLSISIFPSLAVSLN